MAKLFKLNYHPDNIERRKLSKEDIIFLKELQNELNTQDNCGNAEPVFWTLAGTKQGFGYSEDSCDGFVLYESSDTEKRWDNLADFVDDMKIKIKEEIGFDIKEDVVTDDFLFSLEIWNGDKEIQTFNEVEDFISWLGRMDLGQYEFSYYRNEFKVIPDTLFLTHKGAEEHLERYGYNYPSDTHSYAQTAIRSPEVERLWEILRKVDLDSIYIGEG